ncbi:MAG: hypothetical protein KBD16_01375 [Candidatus Pacebacteria bacterium]|nr:hypothetical protein [Candidatus Paceibacterota bacterium]
MNRIACWTLGLVLAVLLGAPVVVDSWVALSNHLNPNSLPWSKEYVGWVTINHQSYWVELDEIGPSKKRFALFPDGVRVVSLEIKDDSLRSQGRMSGMDLGDDGTWDKVSYDTKSSRDPAKSIDSNGWNLCFSMLTPEGLKRFAPDPGPVCSPEEVRLAVCDFNTAVQAIRRSSNLYWHRSRWGFWWTKPPRQIWER